MKRSLLMTALALMMTATAAQAAGPVKVTGWISDSICGAKYLEQSESAAKGFVRGPSTPRDAQSGMATGKRMAAAPGCTCTETAELSAEPVKACIEIKGAKPVFVDAANKTVWTIDNPDAAKGYWGSRVVLSGTADEGKRVVKIDAITIKQ